MRVIPVGNQALLLEVPDPRAWYATLVERRAAGELTATDIVPGATTVLLDGVPDPAGLAARLPAWTPAHHQRDTGRLVEIPVEYSGEDIEDVARLWGTTVEGVVRVLRETEFTVAFCGFAPGFAYLTGLPEHLAVPRLATPRPRVSAGSVGLAGPYAGIYPSASPGGWRLVGRTHVRLFDVTADPPALLTPGTRVRFT